MRFRTGGKRRDFLVAHVNPSDLLACTDTIRNTIQGISRHAKDAFYSRGYQRLNQQFSYSFLGHIIFDPRDPLQLANV
jgi:hypothetical protein